MNGGYFLLDATGLDLSSSSAQSIAGCWQLAKNAIASKKPIIAHNCIYGSGVPVSPVTCFGWYLGESEIVIVGATLHIHVKSDNTCTVLDVAPPTRSAKK